jgi:outer membrane protein assembly factor BamB
MRKKSVIIIGFLFFMLLLFLASISFRNMGLSTASDKLLGNPVWVFKPQHRITTSLLDDKSRLFIQTLDSIYSMDIRTGGILWRASLLADPVYGTPMIVSRDILLAQGRNATISAYSADSGKLLWQDLRTVDYWIEDMVVFEDDLFVARYNTSLTAYNLGDGEILWSKPIPSRNSLFVFPEKEIVYLGTSDSLQAYQVPTYDAQYLGAGTLLWERDLDGVVEYMEKIEDVIYIAYYHDEGISFSSEDIKTFKTLWNIPYKKLPGILSIHLMFIENNILYAIGDRIIAISIQDGKVIWVNDREAAYKKSIISGNYIYAIDDSYLYILDKNTGIEMNRVPLPGQPSLVSLIQGSYSDLFNNGDTLFIVSNGQIYCFSRSSISTRK